MEETAVEVVNLKKTFDGGKTYILNGLNLKIPSGKITVIIGFSGTGKSVLMKHILGLHRPTSGIIKVLGRDLTEMSDEDAIKLRIRMGVLFQHAALFDDMTALENASFPLREHRRDLKRQQIEEIARHKLKLSGLDEIHYDKLPAELSGGMRKRVGLARALALDPQILLYDEPTTGLDPVLTEMVDDLIRDTHNKHAGSSSIVISHDLSAAFRIGHYIVMLNKGEVVLEGTPELFINTDNEFVRRFVNKGLRRAE